MKFSLDLDVFELCTEELQGKLTPMREKFKILEDKKVEEAQKVYYYSLFFQWILIYFSDIH